VTALLGGEWWLQIALAAVISVLLLFLVRPVLRRLLRRGDNPTRHNVDAIALQRGRVLGDFSNGAGEVRLENGETWSARLADSEAGTLLADGDQVTVLRVVGATVEVMKENS